MKNTLLDYLHGNFNSDFDSGLSEGEIRRIGFVNYIGLISMLNMISYVILYSIFDFTLFKPAIIFLIASSLLVSGIIFLNNSGSRKQSKMLMALANPLFMASVATWIFGKEPGFQTFLFAAMIIPLFFWSSNEAKYLVIFIGLSFLLYIVIEFLPPIFKPLIQLPANYIDAFKSTNVLITFGASALALIVYFNLTNNQELKLEKQALELKKAQQHRDIVYSIVAHDLKSPISRLFGITGLLLKDRPKNENTPEIEHLQNIHDSSKTLNNLLDNLFNWSKIQSGRMNIDKKQINLYEIVAEVESLLHNLIKEKQINFVNQMDHQTIAVADANMISAVVRNIISNAIKFTNRGGEITISSKKHQDILELSVIDNGVGISEKVLNQLFSDQKPIYTMGTNNEKGSGLGLKLCKEFVEANGGKIWAGSVIGKGSAFTFTLKIS